MLKSESHVTIQGWMCNEFGLKGNDLLVYALIYGFSQDGESCFYGGRKYIAETFNISLPTVDKALHNLLDSGYIIKYAGDNSTIPDSYCAELNMVVKKFYGGSKETLPYNIYNNKKDSKTISKDIVQNTRKVKKKSLWDSCLELINEFTDNENLHNLLVDFLKICLENSRESGNPFYKNTFKGKLNKLQSLSDSPEEQIKIVMQTLDNGWASFYEIKGKGYSKKEPAGDMHRMSVKANKRRMTNGEKF